MKRVNENNKRKANKKEKYNEYDFEDISIKSSKKISNNINNFENKNKRGIKKEKKKVKKDAKKKPIRKLFLKLFFILTLMLICFCVWFYNKTVENGGGLKGALITVFGLTVEKVESLETINVLLLGISEDLEVNLTDTIILCSYNPQKQVASMISIPRDTFIGKNEASAKGSDKINSLYRKDPGKLLKTVSNLTGIDVDYYAVVKTQALVKIVDIVGGVNFNVPIDMKYDDPTQDLHIHLKKGMQKIGGEEAEQLLRFRHNNDGSSYPANYGDNDFGRMRTQREFIIETIKQTISLKNILKSKLIIDTCFENIETNFIFEDLLPYLVTAIEFNVGTIENYQLPGESKKCNDLWFFVQNEKETEKLVESLNI